MTSPNPSQQASPALGWLLLLPALVGTAISLLLPTIRTILLGFESGRIAGPSQFVGLGNYAGILGDDVFWRALGFTLSLAVVPLLVAVVVGPSLALALDRAGGPLRRTGRVVLSLAIVTFSPVGVAAAWLWGLRSGATGVVTLAEGLRDQATAPVTLGLIIAATTFGLVCALAVMAFLPVLRGGTVTAAMLVVAGLVTLAMIAAALQTFSMGLALLAGGPERSAQTLATLQYDYAFRLFKPGLGASLATIVGVLLGLLGLVATVLVVATNLRISLIPRSGPTDGPNFRSESTSGQKAPYQAPVYGQGGDRPEGGHGQALGSGAAQRAAQSRARGASVAGRVIGAVALALVTLVAVVWAWPWLSALFAGGEAPGAGPRTQVNTWVPAVVGALVSVGVAYLAALGIGGLRPLGRRSEWLLLLFGPWLFVGTGPLSVADWQTVTDMGLIDTFIAIFPPFLVSVPALLLLTLLCKGLSERAGGDFLGGVVLPSLPMAGILAGAVALTNAQEVLWPLLTAHDPGLATAPVALLNRLSDLRAAAPDPGVTTPLAMVLVALLALVAAQLLYLDRLAVTAGKGSRSQTPAA
ncbi:sugar ABC transporter permease [Nonomuraea cavernae]|uniref:Sugar ABC transporter permease n=1 Tax=Nonomuraea cavernae TaxID=2045107 RepID=A0A918DMN6_9ACTN|nr:sugar ABC transporter permease [Nonomuraea cavernae]MCA2188013.1 hypothetical protein [Nonomuraea cavernae]GGO72547.1 hypothetical protein GCM10012289_40800 [Nonomuraea cavernae]